MTEAEKTLRELGCTYKKQPDGTLVAKDIYISKMGLTELPDLSAIIVDGSFFCDGNHLTSLAGAPSRVTGDFYCNDNQLTSLEGMPRKCKEIVSDFGTFSSPKKVPEEIRLARATRARREEERINKFVEEQTVLQYDIKPMRIRLKTKSPIV